MQLNDKNFLRGKNKDRNWTLNQVEKEILLSQDYMDGTYKSVWTRVVQCAERVKVHGFHSLWDNTDSRGLLF